MLGLPAEKEVWIQCMNVKDGRTPGIASRGNNVSLFYRVVCIHIEADKFLSISRLVLGLHIYRRVHYHQKIPVAVRGSG